MKLSSLTQGTSWLIVAVLTTGNQACMKFLATETKGITYGIPWIETVLQSPWVLGIIFCEVFSLILWMRILATTDISRAVPLTSMAYILIIGMSYFVFHEKIELLQILGITLILAGVCLVGLNTSQPHIKGNGYES